MDKKIMPDNINLY